MRGDAPFLALIALMLLIVVVGGGAVLMAAHTRAPLQATCLQSHRSVILVPVMCGKRELCDIPIIADVCERVISPPHAPIPDDPDGD